MDKLLENLKLDIFDKFFMYFIILFIIMIILAIINEFIDIKHKKLTTFISIIIFILIILDILIFGTYILSKNIDYDKHKESLFNEVKNTYNIEQHDDELTFTKKPEIKDLFYKNKSTYKIAKEKVTTNYTYNNQTISEPDGEYYLLTDAHNNKQFKVSKDELKQLISYKKTKQQKFDINELK